MRREPQAHKYTDVGSPIQALTVFRMLRQFALKLAMPETTCDARWCRHIETAFTGTEEGIGGRLKRIVGCRCQRKEQTATTWWTFVAPSMCSHGPQSRRQS